MKGAERGTGGGYICERPRRFVYLFRMRRITITILLVLAAVSLSAQTVDQFHVPAPKVPAYVVFAGDTVRFDRPDFYERMDRELLSFTNMHTNSVLMLKRSRRVFSQIVPLLRKEGIPEDLKYLMAIECNLDPKALSSAGAAGFWQFTKATGRHYGLEVGDEVDERYHTEKATRAACRYLREAYAKYGNWMTVAASYNAGQAGISRRIEQQQEDSALDLWLPEETARYMFRILAAKLFFEHPERFGFHVPEKDCYPARVIKKKVQIKEAVPSLVEFAKANGTTYSQLREANLWLRSDKLTNKAGKTYAIAIPE